jgi:hypothetical protein
VSGFEIITITFSFILGLGVAHILKTAAFVIREREQFHLHWIPISVAIMILLFQVQFWFALVIVDTLAESWTWTIYGTLLLLAIFIFLGGATVLPPAGPTKSGSLIEDFLTRGKISLVFLALYLLGWIGVAILFWSKAFVHLVVVNSSMATISLLAYFAQKPNARNVLHGMLILMMIYGLITVWTPPSFEEPLTGTSAG